MKHLALVVAIAACRSTDVPATLDGGVVAIDAPLEATPPDASLYAIALDMTQVEAAASVTRTISITGPANAELIIGLDRASAGTITPTLVTIDASGHATAKLAPCDAAASGCLGTAKLTLTQDPGVLIATAPFTLIMPTIVGDVAPCVTGGNVLYLHDTATFQSAPTDGWTVPVLPDQIEFDVDGDRATFSLVQLHQALSPGIYENAERAGFEDLDHPGLEIVRQGSGCNMVGGVFQIHDYTADPIRGDLSSVTISFEQTCDGSPQILSGCIHYATTPPTYPAPPPPPDPTKVSVQVLSQTRDGTPDLTASAIFSDGSGVVLDTLVDSFGEAQAALAGDGELTVIEHTSGEELIHTYRALHAGDHVVVNPAVSRSGAEDLMLVHFTPLAGARSASFSTGCGGGTSDTALASTGHIAFYDGCRTPTFSMLTLASGGPTREFVWQTGLTHHANGDVSVPAIWMPYGAATVQLNNIPADSPPLHTTWSTMVDSASIQMDSHLDSSPVAGFETVPISYAPGAGTGTIVDVDIGVGFGLTSESRTIVQAGAPSNVVVDFTTQPIPSVTGIQQTATGAAWVQNGGAANQRRLSWLATLHTGTHVEWELVEPVGGQPTTTLPQLPFAHAAEDPTTDATAQLGGAAITHIAWDTVTGFTLLAPTGNYHAHSATTQTPIF